MVFDYLIKKYGREYCCNVMTLNKLQLKAVIKDVAKVLDVPFEEVNAYTTSIPNDFKHVSELLESAEYKWFFDFNSILQNYDDVRKTITKEKVWENQQIFDKLYNNHQRGKSKNIVNGYGECKANNCKSVEINGITYNSKTEAMKKLGIGRKKLDNMLKMNNNL